MISWLLNGTMVVAYSAVLRCRAIMNGISEFIY
nr:MAG TPA: hypothetical protein [Caudoviricetes sp.]